MAPPVRAIQGQPAGNGAPGARARRAAARPDPRWAADGARLAPRVARAAGRGARDVAHVGPTAVPGLPAVDVVDLQLAVDPAAEAGPAAVEAVRSGLEAAGYPRTDSAGDNISSGGVVARRAPSPGRPVRLAVRVAGSPGVAGGRCCGVTGCGRTRRPGGVPGRGRPSRVTGGCAITRAEEWAASSGWTPSLEELPGP